MRYAYWGFRCKTEGCGFSLLVTKIGPYDEKLQVAPITGQGTVLVSCPSCGKSHEYNRADAQILIVSEAE